jgi:hypothetical protein
VTGNQSTGNQSPGNQPLQKKERNKRKKETNTPLPPKGGKTVDETSFEDFWNAYPRHVGKGKARQLFEAIREKGKATGAEMVAAAKVYASAVRGKEQQYIAHPSTWLNQERWTDELVSRSATKQLERAVAKATSAYDAGPGPLDTQQGFDMETARAIVRGEWSIDRVLPHKRPGVERCLAELGRVPA